MSGLCTSQHPGLEGRDLWSQVTCESRCNPPDNNWQASEFKKIYLLGPRQPQNQIPDVRMHNELLVGWWLVHETCGPRGRAGSMPGSGSPPLFKPGFLPSSLFHQLHHHPWTEAPKLVKLQVQILSLKQKPNLMTNCHQLAPSNCRATIDCFEAWPRRQHHGTVYVRAVHPLRH